MNGIVLNSLAGREKLLGPFRVQDEAITSAWRHWQLKLDEHKVAWLLFDCADADVNVLSQAVLEELDEIVMTLQADKPAALVIRSGKESNFCVGADIKEFGQLDSIDAAREKLGAAHRVANRLTELPFTTVAIVHGLCFGGGLELALCCDFRIGVDGSRFGFPEILLGLHPGLGGTARSLALMDPLDAMTLMLTGKTLRDRQAKRQGLIDALVPERHLGNALAAALAGKLSHKKAGLKAKILNSAPARKLVAKKMRQQAERKAPAEHYPAPNQLIDLWLNHGNNTSAMLNAEIESFCQLLLSDTSRNLVRVFFLQENLKKQAQTPTAIDPVKHVHVIGAGAMGGDIAGWCALQGLTVTLFDMSADIIGNAIARASKLCDKKRLSPAAKRAVLDRLIPDLNHSGARNADIIIEAVPEKIEIKRAVYTTIEPLMKDGAILATNTSSIPLDTLQQELQNPERLVGIHFFNPVAQMQLVEVVKHSKLSTDTFHKALAFTGQIKRLPTPVTGTPGFLVNRALTPYLLEAMQLLDEGVAAETIDQAAEQFGMPMGPIELADVVGLDICLGVADMLRESLDQNMPAAPSWLIDKVKNGDLGKKTGKGLYTWAKGKPKKSGKAATPSPEMADRLILPMLNTCAACLRESVVEDSKLLDGAMIFGTGFAPFSGGPMHYAELRGHEDIVTTLEQLHEKYGARYKPDSYWQSET
ncbi:3-hydroxyacyl-CoA dehydrogenase NAD-binding domain-containing protein [Gilvimarinus sp. SDUM040013]|uniref:enoyl-CoA hydratase n=1 Tax=Gilvimarinus gilvus TaxID=3058038 RepID=A0ABU4RVN0_9GAMM|nr:3-hydroxyacyl-CoA dehydrogenase NAD-binding domain-containing protein [Gilvimarinus sp. SDUM040013]MDO3387910.1 3-hydroxyacyl-CoA dehydrogenase NAD-binding domain-containing protein [Gilvimarinus sp. SDUM040013]MDX6848719.1 3-hydroxyacyl-CoA dehydrogenase NAD-binding domain-containing protein [Gilvimarinus sp. SDUM040013]